MESERLPEKISQFGEGFAEWIQNWGRPTKSWNQGTLRATGAQDL